MKIGTNGMFHDMQVEIISENSDGTVNLLVHGFIDYNIMYVHPEDIVLDANMS